MLNDIIADTLTRIRNGQKAKKLKIVVINTKIVRAILNIFYQEGYIRGYKLVYGNKNILLVMLKYTYNLPTITSIKKISKNSQRIYSTIKKLKKINSGLGLYILSTSKGIISDKEARRINVGGEIICKIF